MTQDDAWWDDVLIAEMIELAKRTGNIQRNPVELKTQSYTQGITPLILAVFMFSAIHKLRPSLHAKWLKGWIACLLKTS